jgi:hypothetical protein
MALTVIGSSWRLNLTVKILSPEQKDAYKPGDSAPVLYLARFKIFLSVDIN